MSTTINVITIIEPTIKVPDFAKGHNFEKRQRMLEGFLQSLDEAAHFLDVSEKDLHNQLTELMRNVTAEIIREDDRYTERA